MSEGSKDSPITQPERKISGPYVLATFNPPTADFQRMVGNSSRAILDIGCGKDPRLSWWLGSRDLWVGCDPAINNDRPTIAVHRSKAISPGAQLVVYPYLAGSVPRFSPDILSAVAPSQREISEGFVFNSELEKFLDPRKYQVFVVALDKRTQEYLGYQGEAKGIIKSWMREHEFEPDHDNEVLSDFKPNSRDLGASKVIGCWVRNG